MRNDRVHLLARTRCVWLTTQRGSGDVTSTAVAAERARAAVRPVYDRGTTGLWRFRWRGPLVEADLATETATNRNGRHQGLATASGALCGPPLGQLTTCNRQS